MSQASLVGDLANWSRSDISQQLSYILAKLLKQLEDSEHSRSFIDVLDCVTKYVLPSVDPTSMEEVLVSHITDKVCVVFDQTLCGVCDLLDSGHVDSQVQAAVMDHLELSIRLLWDLHEMTQHMLTFDLLHMRHIHSLLHVVLPVLKNSYKHCQDSGSLYGDLLGSMSEKLSAMFKRTHSLQMIFTALIDKIHLDKDSSPKDLENLCTICYGFHELTKVVNQLDAKIMITTWKTLSKLCSHYRSLLVEHLDVRPMISSLCQEMDQSYSHLFQLIPHVDRWGQRLSQGDDKTFQKSLKILSFQLKIMTVLVREYMSNVKDCVGEIYNLVLSFFRYLRPCMTAPSIPNEYTQSIESQLMTGVKLLVGILIGDEAFRRLVLTPGGHSDDWEDCPRCLLLLTILLLLGDQSSDLWSQWMSGSDGYPTVLDAAFDSFCLCNRHVCLDSGSVGHRFYQRVCTDMSAFIASCPSVYFKTMECCLLHNVLSFHPLRLILAVDLWCFLARYSTAEMVWIHCCFLCSLLRSLPDAVNRWSSHLVILIRRLIKFLSPQQQDRLLETHPLTTNCLLWSQLPVNYLCEDVLMRSLNQVCSLSVDRVTHALTFCTGWTAMISHIDILANFAAAPCVTPNQMSRLADVCCHLWECLDTKNCSSQLVCSVVPPIIRLSGRVVKELPSWTVLQICTWLLTQLTTGILRQPTLAIEVCKLLKSFADHELDPSSEVLPILPQLFSFMMDSNHPIGHQVALEAFTEFAASTDYENVVGESLQLNSRAEPKVVQFLNKTPHLGDSVNGREFIDVQSKVLQDLCARLEQKTTTNGPNSKRLKRGSAEENADVCRQHVAIIQEQVNLLSSVHKDIGLHDAVIDNLRHVHKEIGKLIS